MSACMINCQHYKRLFNVEYRYLHSQQLRVPFRIFFEAADVVLDDSDIFGTARVI